MRDPFAAIVDRKPKKSTSMLNLDAEIDNLIKQQIRRKISPVRKQIMTDHMREIVKLMIPAVEKADKQRIERGSSSTS